MTSTGSAGDFWVGQKFVNIPYKGVFADNRLCKRQWSSTQIRRIWTTTICDRNPRMDDGERHLFGEFWENWKMIIDLASYRKAVSPNLHNIRYPFSFFWPKHMERNVLVV